MAMSSTYISLFRDEFDDGRVPVWEPGMQISVGHFGTLDSGRFEYLGDVRTMMKDSIFDHVELSAPQGGRKFNHGGKFAPAVTVDGDFGPVAKGKLGLSFEGAGGVRYEAEGLRIERYVQKHLVQRLLQENAKMFDRGTAFVMEIQRITSGSVFVSDADDFAVELSGSADLLEAKRLGKGNISVTHLSGSGYERQMPELPDSPGYAMGLQLYVKGRFNRMKPMAETPENPDEWSPLDPFAIELEG